MANELHRDIFAKACLLHLSSSVWHCTRTVEQSIMAGITENGETAEWLKGRKYLINPELLGPVKSTVQQCRRTVKKYALPFPVTSVYLVPRDSIAAVDAELEKLKEQFWNSFYEFEAVYGDALDEAGEKLGGLFDETDYPADISRKFSLEWRYIAMNLPTKSTFLTPEIYEREKQKFQEMMEETRETAVAALRQEFAEILEYLTERLSENGGKPKVLKDSMFNIFNEFMNEFGNRNIFEDEKLKELTDRAKDLIGGVSAYNLKHSRNMREKITVEMRKLRDSLGASVIDLPRRKITLPEMAEAA